MSGGKVDLDPSRAINLGPFRHASFIQRMLEAEPQCSLPAFAFQAQAPDEESVTQENEQQELP